MSQTNQNINQDSVIGAGAVNNDLNEQAQVSVENNLNNITPPQSPLSEQQQQRVEDDVKEYFSDKSYSEIQDFKNLKEAQESEGLFDKVVNYGNYFFNKAFSSVLGKPLDYMVEGLGIGDKWREKVSTETIYDITHPSKDMADVEKGMIYEIMNKKIQDVDKELKIAPVVEDILKNVDNDVEYKKKEEEWRKMNEVYNMLQQNKISIEDAKKQLGFSGDDKEFVQYFSDNMSSLKNDLQNYVKQRIEEANKFVQKYGYKDLKDFYEKYNEKVGNVEKAIKPYERVLDLTKKDEDIVRRTFDSNINKWNKEAIKGVYGSQIEYNKFQLDLSDKGKYDEYMHDLQKMRTNVYDLTQQYVDAEAWMDKNKDVIQKAIDEDYEIKKIYDEYEKTKKQADNFIKKYFQAYHTFLKKKYSGEYDEDVEFIDVLGQVYKGDIYKDLGEDLVYNNIFNKLTDLRGKLRTKLVNRGYKKAANIFDEIQVKISDNTVTDFLSTALNVAGNIVGRATTYAGSLGSDKAMLEYLGLENTDSNYLSAIANLGNISDFLATVLIDPVKIVKPIKNIGYISKFINNIYETAQKVDNGLKLKEKLNNLYKTSKILPQTAYEGIFLDTVINKALEKKGLAYNPEIDPILGFAASALVNFWQYRYDKLGSFTKVDTNFSDALEEGRNIAILKALPKDEQKIIQDAARILDSLPEEKKFEYIKNAAAVKKILNNDIVSAQNILKADNYFDVVKNYFNLLNTKAKGGSVVGDKVVYKSGDVDDIKDMKLFFKDLKSILSNTLEVKNLYNDLLKVDSLEGKKILKHKIKEKLNKTVDNIIDIKPTLINFEKELKKELNAHLIDFMYALGKGPDSFINKIYSVITDTISRGLKNKNVSPVTRKVVEETVINTGFVDITKRITNFEVLKGLLTSSQRKTFYDNLKRHYNDLNGIFKKINERVGIKLYDVDNKGRIIIHSDFGSGNILFEQFLHLLVRIYNLLGADGFKSFLYVLGYNINDINRYVEKLQAKFGDVIKGENVFWDFLKITKDNIGGSFDDLRQIGSYLTKYLITQSKGKGIDFDTLFKKYLHVLALTKVGSETDLKEYKIFKSQIGKILSKQDSLKTTVELRVEGIKKTLKDLADEGFIAKDVYEKSINSLEKVKGIYDLFRGVYNAELEEINKGLSIIQDSPKSFVLGILEELDKLDVTGMLYLFGKGKWAGDFEEVLADGISGVLNVLGILQNKIKNKKLGDIKYLTAFEGQLTYKLHGFFANLLFNYFIAKKVANVGNIIDFIKVTKLKDYEDELKAMYEVPKAAFKVYDLEMMGKISDLLDQPIKNISDDILKILAKRFNDEIKGIKWENVEKVLQLDDGLVLLGLKKIQKNEKINNINDAYEKLKLLKEKYPYIRLSKLIKIKKGLSVKELHKKYFGQYFFLLDSKTNLLDVLFERYIDNIARIYGEFYEKIIGKSADEIRNKFYNVIIDNLYKLSPTGKLKLVYNLYKTLTGFSKVKNISALIDLLLDKKRGSGFLGIYSDIYNFIFFSKQKINKNTVNDIAHTMFHELGHFLNTYNNFDIIKKFISEFKEADFNKISPQIIHTSYLSNDIYTILKTISHRIYGQDFENLLKEEDAVDKLLNLYNTVIDELIADLYGIYAIGNKGQRLYGLLQFIKNIVGLKLIYYKFGQLLKNDMLKNYDIGNIYVTLKTVFSHLIGNELINIDDLYKAYVKDNGIQIADAIQLLNRDYDNIFLGKNSDIINKYVLAPQYTEADGFVNYPSEVRKGVISTIKLQNEPIYNYYKQFLINIFSSNVEGKVDVNNLLNDLNDTILVLYRPTGNPISTFSQTLKYIGGEFRGGFIPSLTDEEIEALSKYAELYDKNIVVITDTLYKKALAKYPNVSIIDATYLPFGFINIGKGAFFFGYDGYKKIIDQMKEDFVIDFKYLLGNEEHLNKLIEEAFGKGHKVKKSFHDLIISIINNRLKEKSIDLVGEELTIDKLETIQRVSGLPSLSDAYMLLATLKRGANLYGYEVIYGIDKGKIRNKLKEKIIDIIVSHQDNQDVLKHFLFDGFEFHIFSDNVVNNFVKKVFENTGDKREAVINDYLDLLFYSKNYKINVLNFVRKYGDEEEAKRIEEIFDREEYNIDKFKVIYGLYMFHKIRIPSTYNDIFYDAFTTLKELYKDIEGREKMRELIEWYITGIGRGMLDNASLEENVVDLLGRDTYNILYTVYNINGQEYIKRAKKLLGESPVVELKVHGGDFKEKGLSIARREELIHMVGFGLFLDDLFELAGGGIKINFENSDYVIYNKGIVETIMGQIDNYKEYVAKSLIDLNQRVYLFKIYGFNFNDIRKGLKDINDNIIEELKDQIQDFYGVGAQEKGILNYKIKDFYLDKYHFFALKSVEILNKIGNIIGLSDGVVDIKKLVDIKREIVHGKEISIEKLNKFIKNGGYVKFLEEGIDTIIKAIDNKTIKTLSDIKKIAAYFKNKRYGFVKVKDGVYEVFTIKDLFNNIIAKLYDYTEKIDSNGVLMDILKQLESLHKSTPSSEYIRNIDFFAQILYEYLLTVSYLNKSKKLTTLFKDKDILYDTINYVKNILETFIDLGYGKDVKKIKEKIEMIKKNDSLYEYIDDEVDNLLKEIKGELGVTIDEFNKLILQYKELKKKYDAGKLVLGSGDLVKIRKQMNELEKKIEKFLSGRVKNIGELIYEKIKEAVKVYDRNYRRRIAEEIVIDKATTEELFDPSIMSKMIEDLERIGEITSDSYKQVFEINQMQKEAVMLKTVSDIKKKLYKISGGDKDLISKFDNLLGLLYLSKYQKMPKEKIIDLAKTIKNKKIQEIINLYCNIL